MPYLTNAPVPSLTGNPGLDSIVRSVLIGASAFLTGIILAWLNSKGFATTDLTFLGMTVSPTLLVGTAVFTTLITLFGAFWGWFKGTQVGQLVLATKIQAANAGLNLGLSNAVESVVTQSGNVVPKPITAATVDAVVKTFGPAIAPILGQPSPPGTTADDLNGRKLP